MYIDYVRIAVFLALFCAYWIWAKLPKSTRQRLASETANYKRWLLEAHKKSRF